MQTTLAYRGARLLRGFDAELGTRLAEEMAQEGRCGLPRMQARQHGEARRFHQVDFNDGTAARRSIWSCSPPAASRTRAGLGLEAAGVKLAADGAVVVDNYSNSSVDSIHAIGDVTNRLNLTPVATAEGMALAQDAVRRQADAGRS